MTDPTYTLRFGSIDFSPNGQLGDVEYQILGLQFGRPVPVSWVAESMLQDGADERVESHGNRDQSVLIGIKGPDADVLARAESALFLEAQKLRNELSWTPPDGYGAETVFDVLWCDLGSPTDRDDWDLDELRGFRIYVLTVRAAPFGRDATETVYEALSAAPVPSTVSISDGTSATGWTSPNGAVTVASGHLVVPVNATPAATYADAYGNRIDTFNWETTRTLSATDFTATQYVTAEFDRDQLNQYGLDPAQAFVDGVELPLVSATWISGGYGRRCTWICNDSSGTLLKFVGSTKTNAPISGGPSVPSVRVDNVSRSNQPPVLSTTGRQSLRSITVGGSARTQGRFMLEHATAGLGDGVVFSCPSLATGYSPELRRWKTAGAATPTTDTTTVSGIREDFGDPVFNVPAAQLPRGGYLLYARVRATSGTPTATLSVSAATKIGSTLFTEVETSGEPVTLSTAAWTIVPMGSVTLPTTDVPDGSAATVEIAVDSSGGSVEWDEMWMFYAGDDSALTIVSLGAGTPALGTVHNRLRLDAPSLERRKSVWAGTLSDWSDSFHAGSLASVWQVPSLLPGENTFFVVTTGATFAELTVAAFNRHHTHATQKPA